MTFAIVSSARACGTAAGGGRLGPAVRAHGRGQPGEDVDEHDRSAGDDDDERAEHEKRADEVAPEHHPDPAVAIPESCRRGVASERRSTNIAPTAAAPPFLVRAHAERDLEAVVADDRAGPRYLQQPQLAVAEDRADGPVVFVGRAQGIRRSAQSRISPIGPSKEIPALSAIRVRSPTAVPMAGQRVALEKVHDAGGVEPEVEPGDVIGSRAREGNEARARDRRERAVVEPGGTSYRTNRSDSLLRRTSRRDAPAVDELLLHQGQYASGGEEADGDLAPGDVSSLSTGCP